MIGKIFEKINYYLMSNEKYAEYLGVTLGEGCRLIGKNEFGSEPYLVKFGNRVSVTNSTFVTHDGGVWVLREEFPLIDVIAPITVGNNVFIGSDCIILPGVTIGDNVIIGAGSVVTKDVNSGTVAAGVPARYIKSIDEFKKSAHEKSYDTKNLSTGDKKKYLLEVIWGIK